MKFTLEIAKDFKEKFNPDGSNLRKAQLRMLDMLLWFDSVMKKNNIPYILSSGTLLGAVRHKGFIPWDDDIDVHVFYEDINRIRKAFETEFHPNYKYVKPSDDKFSFYAWDVIRDTKSQYVHSSTYMNRLEDLKSYRGLQVDLFPLDKHVNQRVENIITYRNWAQTIVGNFGTSICVKYVALIFFKIQDTTWKIAHNLTSEKKTYAFKYGSKYSRPRYKIEDVWPLTKVEFEGHLFPAPHNYDSFLKEHFGNYMELPDDAEFNHHKLSQIKIG